MRVHAVAVWCQPIAVLSIASALRGVGDRASYSSVLSGCEEAPLCGVGVAVERGQAQTPGYHSVCPCLTDHHHRAVFGAHMLLISRVLGTREKGCTHCEMEKYKLLPWVPGPYAS